jgi:hypothetical protein
VEEIDDIPEFSISQSVAANVVVKIEYKTNTINPVLRFGRDELRDIMLSTREATLNEMAWAVRIWNETVKLRIFQ